MAASLGVWLVILSCILHSVLAEERLTLNLLQKLIDAWLDRPLSVKAASFAFVGVVNTLIDVNVFAIAYAIFGIPLIPANVLAWFVAVSFSYAANAMTTFGPESGQVLTVIPNSSARVLSSRRYQSRDRHLARFA